MSNVSALDSTNVHQFNSWDGVNGTFSSERAERFDAGMASFHRELLRAAGNAEDSVILDIGSGAGQVARDAARIVRSGSALGVDLRSPLLELACSLAAKEQVSDVSFVQADAQVYDFGTARFDVGLSRYGTCSLESH